MKIRDFEIGAGRTFIIAETCSNIIGHLDRLETIVRDVAWTGATALKIQLFRGDHFGEKEAESKRRLEFPRDRFLELVELCHKYGLACGASVFDREAVDLVLDSSADFIKLASREWLNRPLILRALATEMPVLRSFDATNDDTKFEDWYPYYKNLLHLSCTPDYPSEKPKISGFTANNGTLSNGFSSHTSHWIDCLIAVSRHDPIIEKHISFHANDPERGWSLDPQSFKAMVKDISWVESCR